MAQDQHAAVRRTVEAVWRIEAGRLVASLARLVRDVGLAEELAQDALVAALEQWPAEGVPTNPGAWLAAVGRRRAVDLIRRQETLDRKHAEIGRALELDGPAAGADVEAEAAMSRTAEDHIGDDLLRLVFIACHPVVPPEGRIALTLRLLGGLSTAEIARAFLVPEPTMAARITRAKKALAKAGVAFSTPEPHELGRRLASVLEVLYLIFNEGYAATAGADLTRPALCGEAMRLGRVLAGLMPAEPEVHGLVALLELQASRIRARTAADGSPVLLADQDRGRWDRLLIGRGLAALDRAHTLGGIRGPYALQAAIAACHARARVVEETDWVRIAALYEALGAVAPSPVVELNRAVAVSRAYGPVAGLALADALAAEPALSRYHLLPAVRGDLLEQLGRTGEARAEFERAAALTRNGREQAVLRARAAACRAD